MSADPSAAQPTGTADPQRLAERCAETLYAGDDAIRQLRIAISEVTPGRATARMRVTEAMVNGHGIAHGGYVFLLADTAFAYACNSYGASTVARGADVVFVAPARVGDELVAICRERVRFGRSGVYDVTVRGAGGAVVAEFRGQSATLSTRLVPE